MTKQKRSKASKVVLHAVENKEKGIFEVIGEIPKDWNGYRPNEAGSFTWTWESAPGSAQWETSTESPYKARWTTFDEIYERNKDALTKDMKRIFEEAIRGSIK